jgi:hypothetical protein
MKIRRKNSCTNPPKVKQGIAKGLGSLFLPYLNRKTNIIAGQSATMFVFHHFSIHESRNKNKKRYYAERDSCLAPSALFNVNHKKKAAPINNEPVIRNTLDIPNKPASIPPSDGPITFPRKRQLTL